MDDISGLRDGVVSDLKENCVFAIKSTVNTTSDDSGQQEDVVLEIVREVEDVSCPGEPIACSGHGTCSMRRCTCHSGSCDVLCISKL